MLHAESMANVGMEQGSLKDQRIRWCNDSSRPTSTLDEMCEFMDSVVCCPCPLDEACPNLGFGLFAPSPSWTERLGEDFSDCVNDNPDR